jgi:corrinoid protein of di/trimethylamine methyltransferase
MESMDIFEKIYNAIVNRDREKAIDLSKEIVEKGIDPVQAIEQGFKRGMEKIGDLFADLEIFIPDMISAADIMNEGLAILRPYLKTKGEEMLYGKILLGTIQGDVHEIGKNIVKVLLEGSGFEVIDLGRDVDVLTFIDKYQELNPDIIGISALMTTTMVNIPRVIENLKTLGIRDEVKIMVGGAPVLPDWAEEIGADGYGNNAREAVEVAKKLLKEKRGVRDD